MLFLHIFHSCETKRKAETKEGKLVYLKESNLFLMIKYQDITLRKAKIAAQMSKLRKKIFSHFNHLFEIHFHIA